MRQIFSIIIFSYLTFSASKWFHCFRRYKFEIISCLCFKCDSIFYFIYVSYSWRIISSYLMIFKIYLTLIRLGFWGLSDAGGEQVVHPVYLLIEKCYLLEIWQKDSTLSIKLTPPQSITQSIIFLIIIFFESND